MNLPDPGLNLDTRPDNVVAFPGAHRSRTTKAADIPGPPLPRNKRSVAAMGAEINARLLILLGICTTSAAVALSAVHILQAS